MATIAIKERIVKTDFGVIELNEQHELVDYIEKPQHKSYVSMGVNILSKKCRHHIKSHESLGMPELMLRLKTSGTKVCCFETSELWLDLGRRDDLEVAQEIFKKHRKKFLFEK